MFAGTDIFMHRLVAMQTISSYLVGGASACFTAPQAMAAEGRANHIADTCCRRRCCRAEQNVTLYLPRPWDGGGYKINILQINKFLGTEETINISQK